MQKENETNILGNSTTIINTIILMIVGIIFGKYGATLLKLGIDQTLLTEILTLIIFTTFAYINAKHHNNLFPTKPTNTTTTEDPNKEIFDNDAPTVLNDEYIVSDDDGC